MEKVEALSKLFTKGSQVLVFCTAPDIKSFFDEIDNLESKSNYGKFKNEGVALGMKSFSYAGVTFHMGDDIAFELLFKK